MDDTISSFGTFASPVKPNSKLNDFKILCKLGEGSFSTVFKVLRLVDNKIYAMKKVQMSRLNEKEKGNSLNEIRILASIKCDHIIEYRDSFFDDQSDTLCIVMEYAGSGDLLQKLKEYKLINEKLLEDGQNETSESQVEQDSSPKEESDKSSRSQEKNKRIYNKLNQQNESIKSKKSSIQENSSKSVVQDKQQQMVFMDEELIWDYFIQCLKGLKCLHDLKIVHRDLKCANIFIGDNNIIKIGDLNVSKVTRRPEQMAKTQTGTPYYTAPEVWKGLSYNYKSDVWSLGCIIYELSAQKHPFKGNTIEGLFTNIMKGQYERIPSFYSEELAFVISQCLLQNPKLRPGCDQLLKLPAFASRLQKYEEKYRQYLQNHNKQKIHSNFLNVTSQNHLEFTPQRVQKTNTEGPHLIDTINMPSNLKQLSALLPKSNYEDTPIQLPSISEFDENIVNNNNHLHNKSNFMKLRASVQKVSEFDQLEKISSADSSSSSSSPSAATNRITKNFKDNNELQNDQLKTSQMHQDNIFQALLDLQPADILNQKLTLTQQQKETTKLTNKKMSQLQPYHDLVNDSPIRFNLQKVQMENKNQEQKSDEKKENSERKNITLQKIDFINEQKNHSGLSQNNNTKNTISTNAQTFKNNDASNKKQSYQTSSNKNEEGITSRGSPNISLVENISIQEKNPTLNSQNNSLEVISNYMKKLKMRPQSSAIRNCITVECQNNSSKCSSILNVAPHPSQQNLEINQQQTLITEETCPKFIVPNVRYSQNSSNIIQTQSTFGEESFLNKKLKNVNGYYNDVRNYRIRYARQGSKDNRIQASNINSNVNSSFNNYNNNNSSFNNNYNSNVNNSFNNYNYNKKILKSEEDSTSYSPSALARGFIVPYSAIQHDKNSRISTIISSSSQQPRRLPSSGRNNQKKSYSPINKITQFTQLMKRYLPKGMLKNCPVSNQERNNSNNSSINQNNHRSPIVYQKTPNSAKYPSHKIAAAAAFNTSLVSQLNNSSINSNNYSFNNQNISPVITSNKENVNTANILDNSFALIRHQARQNIYKNNNQQNGGVRAVQYEKNFFNNNNNNNHLNCNTNHIQIVKKLGNVNNVLNSHTYNINRSSPPKKAQQKDSQHRKNIFYHPNYINCLNQNINSSIVQKVAYVQNPKSLNSKISTSNNQSSSQERKQIKQILR
ncbi:Serine/Threonine kinase domain protein (macronuclear) [Tetrahymena thermophila SB210]|uniref:non-specific serine/threonine protein kinase n=1 Tax=Tetrahymena thermophila (strain SB210) TaxID=312017 RepID=Q22CK8_TETTS|nr:Serine/Threonine kinase domain protein [Tetrahymena thermophila SB210]EAR83044.2 Serine/Threonine kinase domain protein [Tetrahymena thermophila SB210]|eukprot:XP_001030707.2 Serine/Threonine kinase domain protein [Tetrahymena thermophila SB210]